MFKNISISSCQEIIFILFKRNDIVIGFDFGTSSSKIVTRDTAIKTCVKILPYLL